MSRAAQYKTGDLVTTNHHKALANRFQNKQAIVSDITKCEDETIKYHLTFRDYIHNGGRNCKLIVPASMVY